MLNVSGKTTSIALSEILLNQLDQLQCKEKTICQTYDGAAVMASHLHGVQALVKEAIPGAMFIHCHAHVLNLVLSQSVSTINEARVFFANLRGISSFFHHLLNESPLSRISRNNDFQRLQLQGGSTIRELFFVCTTITVLCCHFLKMLLKIQHDGILQQFLLQMATAEF